MNSIKLNGNNDLEALRQSQRTDPTRETGDAKSASTDQGVVTAPTDSIEVSGRAAAVRRFIEQAGQLPEMRMDQVTRYKAEIEAGSYNPPADAIADALLKSGLEDGAR